MLTTDPRIKNYRASRLRMWEDLMRQHHAYVEYFQENEGLHDDAAKIDVHRFDGPVNVLLDELLTHLRRDDAAALVKALLPGWGSEPDLVLYWGDKLRSYIERTHPDVQWGTGQVDPAVAADLARWQPWLAARLDALAVPKDRVFAQADPSTRHVLPAAPPAPWRSWQKVLLAAAGFAVVVGGSATVYVLATRRRALKLAGAQS
jgi:hypothetical protein